MVEIIRRKVEAGEKEVFVEREDGLYAFPRKVDALETAVTINPQDYALIQEEDQAVYAISMTQGYNGDNQKDTTTKVLKAGLGVPRASRFIRQWLNVNQASQGKGVLYDASGNLIEGDRLKKYTHTLNHNHWVWSPESFRKGEGHLGLDIVTISGLNKKGNPIYKTEPLERCLGDDCYADLDSANSQGFLTQIAKTQKYEPGKTVYFYYPRQDSAVRFGAPSGAADFDCDGDPQCSVDGLGVFVCAEGE